MRPLQAHCHMVSVPCIQNRPAPEARLALSTAIELYRAMEMTFWFPQVDAALAEVEAH